MFDHIRQLWAIAKPLTKYQIVEIEKPRQVAELDPESAASVTSLSAHPGFTYLVAKLKYQRSLLETKLKHEHHDSLRAVEFLQSGIFWASWLEEQVNREVFRVKRATTQPATDIEAAVFDAALANLEVVGRDEV